MSTLTVKPIRSYLFVPALKASMIERGAAAGADALILDLEDSVPPAVRLDARALVVNKLPWLAEKGQRVYVRINRSPYLYDFDDLKAVVGPHLEGIIMSKPIGPEDVECLSMMLSEVEHQKALWSAPLASCLLLKLLGRCKWLMNLLSANEFLHLPVPWQKRG